MKKIRYSTYFQSLILVYSLLLLATSGMAQQKQNTPGVQYVMINFVDTPTTLNINKAILRYNKDFALSFHTDDGFEDVFTLGFSFFTGINSSGTNYPGLFYTDGCGNDISFKLSNSVFSYSGYNNTDMHQPGNGFGTVTWPQLSVMYENGCSVNNHGFTSDAFTEPEYMKYSIRRNESFIRRRLLTTTPSGVKTRIFVNPNGATPYTNVAFAEGYRSTLRMGASGIIPNNGLDVGTLNNWNQPLELNRTLGETVNVQQMADQFAAAATTGKHLWMPIFTHRIVEDYPQASFLADFNYIATTYGKNGSDNIWMTTEEEIIDYQIVRQMTTINYALTGNTAIVTLTGDLPVDLRYYALSLVVESDAAISSINIIGGSGNSHNGVGQNKALINLRWQGRVVDDLLQLAENNVSYAEANPTEHNALVAMDYVLMLPQGADFTSLKNRLCNLQGIEYEAGFCSTCEVSLGDDFEICAGQCATLEVEEVTGTSYLWSTGETTASIVYCPLSTNDVWVKVTDADGCIAQDTVTITVLPTVVFELGEDIFGCPGDTINISGPNNPDYVYAWMVDGVQQPETGSVLQMILSDTTMVKLNLTTVNGCLSSDSLMVFVRDVPIVELTPSSADLCIGESVTLNGAVQFAETYEWWNGSTGVTSVEYAPSEAGTTACWLQATNGYGCKAADTAFVTAHPLPDFSLSIEGGTTSICAGTEVGIHVEIDPSVPVVTLVWNGTITVPTNGQTSITRNFTLNQSSTITVKAITAYGCFIEKEISVTVSPKPSMTISNDAAICIGESVTLLASGGQSCSWTYNNQTIASSYSIEVSPTVTSYYFATIMGAAPTFCTNRDSVLVTVHPLPVVTIQASDSQVCSGSSVVLTASGAASYLWGNNSTLAQITVQPLENTTYSVEGFSTFGCGDTASINISVLPAPQAVVSGLLPVYCENDSPSVIVGTPAGGVFSGIELVGNKFIPSVAGAGNHTLYYQVTNVQGCVGTDSASTNVIAFDKSIELGPDVAICPQETVLLDAGEGFDTYYWSTGHQSRQVEINAASYLPGTSRKITVIGVSEGCSTADSILFTVRDDCYIGLYENDLAQIIHIIPNPNNGKFEVQSSRPLANLQLGLMTLAGKIIWLSSETQNIEAGSKYSVTLPEISNGIYLLQIKSGEMQSLHKIVIRK